MTRIRATAEKYRMRCAQSARAHYMSWENAVRWNRCLGSMAVVASTVVGTTIFGTINSNPEVAWKITAGLISLLAAVLSGLQTFLRHPELAEKHKAAGARYSAMRRKLELFELEYADQGEHQRDAALKNLNILAEKLADLANESPSIRRKYYDKAVDIMKKEKENARKDQALNEDAA